MIYHSVFFKITNDEEDGKRHLANMIKLVCELIQKLTDIGVMYGNLRTENLMIKLCPNHENIEDIKFLSFCNMVKFDQADQINIPERIEHLPPELLKHLMNIERFDP